MSLLDKLKKMFGTPVSEPKSAPIAKTSKIKLESGNSGQVNKKRSTTIPKDSYPDLNQNKIGQTALHIAAKKGDLESIKFISRHISYYSNNNKNLSIAQPLNYEDESGNTALDIAINLNHKDIIKYLSSLGAMSTNIYNAVKGNETTYIEKVIKDYEININDYEKSGYSLLSCAVIYGNIEMAKLLIDKKADVNLSERGWCILGSAIKNGDLNMVKILVENGASVDHAGIQISSIRKAVEQIKEIRETSEVKSENIINYLDIIKFLIERGANPNMNDLYSSATAECITPNDKYLDILEFLLENGADANKCEYFSTPYWIKGNSCQNSYKLLNKYGANIKY